MHDVLKQVLAHPESTEPHYLIRLVNTVRPGRTKDVAHAINALAGLTARLQKNPAEAAALRAYLLGLLAARRHVHLYSDVGILTTEGFFSTLYRRLMHRLLPEEVRQDRLRDLFGEVFCESDDYEWVNAVPDEAWGGVLEAMDFAGDKKHPGYQRMLHELLEALEVLSYRVAAIGLEPELVRNHPQIECFESPFLAQNAEVRGYYKRYMKAMAGEDVAFDDRHLAVLLEQCDEVLDKVRRQASHNGASISLTYHLQRAHQMLERMHALLSMIDPAHANIRLGSGVRLFRDLVREENRRYSLRDVIRRGTDLVALQVTENVSQSGGKYAASSRAEYFSILRSSMGAGFLVAIMSLIKIGLARLSLAPVAQAFVYSMNYSFGFMLMHLMHLTLSTRQPSMTAATIAATIDTTGGKRALLEGVVDLIVAVIRTQLLAIFGNVIVALPMAILIAVGWTYWFGVSPASTDKALHLLHETDPIGSLALWFAAISGVCLFVAGLISGYYDNLAAYNRVAARLRQLRWLRTLLGKARLARFADYVGNNLGPLAGYFAFGVMLGSLGIVGFILGLPIDTTHVAFSSANVGYALVALDFSLGWQLTLLYLTGVALIGAINLGVSFVLALYVALKSRHVRFSRSGELLGLLLRRLVTRPQEFLFPPADETKVPLPSEKATTPKPKVKADAVPTETKPASEKSAATDGLPKA